MRHASALIRFGKSVQSRTMSVRIPVLGIDEIRASNSSSDDSLFAQVNAGFGPNGPGALAITGPAIQERLRHIRANFLPQALQLTNLTEDAKDRLKDPDSPLTNGLSRGVEVTDRAKSSFYYHPFTDKPGDHLPEGVDRVPLFHNPNLFPTEEEMPGFKAAARDAAQFVVEIGNELAQLIDRRLAGIHGYVAGSLAKTVRLGPTSNHKCRLIIYHPYKTQDEVVETKGMWAAPHLDTGSLTGLVPGIFLDKDGNQSASPDANAGLYIMDRSGAPMKAEVPPDVGEALLFQIGEGLQITSGGELQATPHFVQGPATAQPDGASRVALAVFMQPQPHEHLLIPSTMTYEQVAAKTADRHLPPEWPSLAWRFQKLQQEGKLEALQPLTFGMHGYVTFSNLGAATDNEPPRKRLKPMNSF
eukprot:TRINITY_DN109396_c0_g1_i1.p1 TRINITY_DN109396_c0_g1~~TRINITY_DN109396_c0_g1_i1.p1  ORF type:complete len:416 (-),score=60.74 TRINITY_DN109396_c0_g1_i1:258-1505(-)